MTPGETPDTSPPILVELARRDDARSLIALDRLCFGPVAWPATAWQEVVRGGDWAVLVVRHESQLAAASVLLLAAPVASLASIAVHPSFRRRGIGTLLTRDAIHRARGAVAQWLSLEVDADNGTARALYRREGFSVVRRFIEDGRPRIEMWRRLGRR